MNEEEVNKKIQQMVRFIQQEAKEKADEIHVKTEEEFNIEMLRQVEAEKRRIRSEFERKEKLVEVQKRVAVSNEVHAQQLKVLQARDAAVHSVLDTAREKLKNISGNKGQYGSLLKDLIVQGLHALNEPKVSLIIRAEDKSVVQSAIPQAVQAYKAQTSRDCEVTISDDQQLPANSAGGVTLTGTGGKIQVRNTLEARLDQLFAAMLPEIRIALFGRSATREHLV
eukprot:TRINITY_DN1993_c0_g1_i2.p1 TRINITY_DN1993_c0_g1~~TRINITY_DN1993_c0_g1_i2.p1  ORF type:complete len:225 (-),score=72.86 TRINITY_DN1993_c0_g1_i2:178-852(-)